MRNRAGPIEIILIIGLIGYVLVRRFAGEPVEGRRTPLVPAVLAVVGAVPPRRIRNRPRRRPPASARCWT